MKTLQSNLLIRFSVVSFVIIFVIALVIGFILTDKLNGEIDLLNDHGNAMTQGMPMEMSDPYSIPNLAENVKQLKWLTGVSFTVGFLVLYVGLVSTVWRGWKTITAQRSRLETFNADLEQQVKARTAELQATIDELEAFSYAVSHDLRAPLRSINGFGQALYEDYGDEMDAQAKEYLEKVRSSTQKMEQMIEGLLELSRLSRVDMEAAEIDLSQIANSVAQDLKEAQPERNVEFSIQDRVVGKGDPRLLRIAMENLLGNAWKYTAKRSQALIQFGATGQNGSKAYFVKDDGAGFDMTYADKLFGAFQRLHSDTEFEGTGIGLATVQRIVQRHGGKIWAESEAERGATFYFTLELSGGGANTGQRQVSLAG